MNESNSSSVYSSKNANGDLYEVGSDKGKNFINSANAGTTMTGGDGSQWVKNADGTTTVTTTEGKVFNFQSNNPSPATANATAAEQTYQNVNNNTPSSNPYSGDTTNPYGGSGTTTSNAAAAETAYQQTTQGRGHWNAAGDRYDTYVRDANGNEVPGYIDLNGIGHLADGSYLPAGYSIETQNNGWYTQGTDTGSAKTTYQDSRGNTYDAYIINGKTYTDPEGTREVPVGSYVTDAYGRVWRKENGNRTALISSPFEEDHYNPNDFLNAGETKEFTLPQTGKTMLIVSDPGAGVWYVQNADHQSYGYITPDGTYHSAYPEEDKDIAEAAIASLRNDGVVFNGVGYAKIAEGADRDLDYITNLNLYSDELAAGRDGADILAKMGFKYDSNGKVVPIQSQDGTTQAPIEIANTLNTIARNSGTKVNIAENAQTAANTSDISQRANSFDTKSLNTILKQIEQSGVNTDALRQRINTLYQEGNYDEIKELLNESIAENVNLDYGTSDTFNEAYDAFFEALSNKTELNFAEANRTTTDYNPTDYTTQINEIHDKAFQTAKTQIENQLALGELDIDQAIEKVPSIYEAGMNDMTQAYEMNKRNANEYFNANGLSTGARAQAMLAMNNVYQANMADYRLQQANAIQEYENQRAKLKLEAQGKITEALLQNEQNRASDLLAEYQRQDEYNFKWLLQKMDDDFRYYQLETDKEIKRAAFEEEQRRNDISAYKDVMTIEEQRRQADNALRIQEAELLQKERQLIVDAKLDIAKLEEEARQRGINTELSLAEMAQKDSQFKISSNIDVQTLIEKAREFGISTDLSLAELAEKARQYDIDLKMSEAELNEKIRANNLDYDLSVAKLKEEARQADQTIALNRDKLEEDKRQFDAKNSGSKSGNPNYTPSDDGGVLKNANLNYADAVSALVQNAASFSLYDANGKKRYNSAADLNAAKEQWLEDQKKLISQVYGVDVATIDADLKAAQNSDTRLTDEEYTYALSEYYQYLSKGNFDSQAAIKAIAAEFGYPVSQVEQDIKRYGGKANSQ